MKFQVKPSSRGGAEKIDPFSLVTKDLKRVEALIRSKTSSDVGLILEVGRYVFDSGGKRFRPAIHMLCCKLLDFEGESRLWMAAALECIHTATLLHDDVVDGASLRRGVPSANAKWGDHTAVLVGDFLFATSVQWVLNTENPDMPRKFAEVCAGMAEGEAYQLTIARQRRLVEEDYLRVVGLKTAGLISLACSSAAMLAGSDPKTTNALAKFGREVGMAFQIVDDALDYNSRENELGKSIGKDLEEGKITLPMLRALDVASPADRKSLERILESKTLAASDLAEAQKLIHKYDGIDFALDRATGMIEEGKNALRFLKPSPALDALFDLADFTVTRDR